MNESIRCDVYDVVGVLIPELGVEGGLPVAGLVRRGGPCRSGVVVFVFFGVGVFGVTTTG